MKKSYKVFRAWLALTFILSASSGILVGRAYDNYFWLAIISLLFNCTAYFIILGAWMHMVKEKDRINEALTKSELENKEMYYYITRIANSRNHRISANKLLQRLEGR